jgi:hypothetical protein
MIVDNSLVATCARDGNSAHSIAMFCARARLTSGSFARIAQRIVAFSRSSARSQGAVHYNGRVEFIAWT